MPIPLQAVIIMDHSGLPLFFSKIDPRATNIDPALISGFLQAFTAFGDELFTNEINQEIMVLDYGFRKVCLAYGKHVSAVILTKEFTEEIRNILLTILSKFEETFCSSCLSSQDPCNNCLVLSDRGADYFSGFHNKLVSDPLFRGWQNQWVPYIVDSKVYSEFKPKSNLLDMIDGNISIEEILEKTNQNQDIIIDLFLAYNHGFINFKNILQDDDFFILTNERELQKYIELQLKISQDKLGYFYSTLKNQLNGKTSLSEIKKTLDTNIEIDKMIEELINKGAIILSQPGHRRLALALDVVEICLKHLDKRCKGSRKIIQEVLSDFKDPKLSLNLCWNEKDQIPTLASLYTILQDVSYYDITKTVQRWFDFAQALMKKGSKCGKKRFLEDVIEDINDKLSVSYRAKDLEGIEGFLYKLEHFYVENH